MARSRRSVVAATATALPARRVRLVRRDRAQRRRRSTRTRPCSSSLAMTPTTVDTSVGPGRGHDHRPPHRRTEPVDRRHRAAQPDRADRTRRPAAGDRVRLAGATHLGHGDRRRLPRRRCTIPWHAAPGHWNASAVLVDISGNTRTLTHRGPRRRGLPVDRSTRPARATPRAPQLVALGIAPASVDTSLQSATITVSVHAVDDLSGVSDGVDDGGEPGRAARTERRAPRAGDVERRPPHRGQPAGRDVRRRRSRCRAGRSRERGPSRA